MYLDLDELPTLFDGVPFWSAKRPALACFRRKDYYGDANKPLAECLRDLVEKNVGQRPRGPIRMLTNLRYFGYIINPAVAGSRDIPTLTLMTRNQWMGFKGAPVQQSLSFHSPLASR